ncbi:MAG: helix-hairpin-helix domain-containing protein, partial [Treponema sp.]|nr:helix-hairpin-helix domain-containing protein [Treponema sp.]
DDYADTGYGNSVKYEPTVIKVDVEGAVKKPGLKTLKGDKDRLDDAIKAAKGFKRFADKDQLNLAMKVCDGMKIVVPEYGQQLIIEGASQGTGKGFVGKVNVNTATSEELQQIPGIGPSYAQRIIEHRSVYGPFRSPNDLLAIKGIGKKKLATMKDNLAF